jgi:hypothetical protein
MLVGNTITLRQGYYDNPWRAVIDYLDIKSSIFHLPDEDHQAAKDNYLRRRERNTRREIDV